MLIALAHDECHEVVDITESVAHSYSKFDLVVDVLHPCVRDAQCHGVHDGVPVSAHLLRKFSDDLHTTVTGAPDPWRFHPGQR